MVVSFCHDYQNALGCSRENCRYLHTTKEEESLFFATGQLPGVLADRHADMSATAAETIPQIALYIQESLVGHPPPPPLPPMPVSAPSPSVPATGASSVTTMVPLQQLLPPPPPPTVPSTTAAASTIPILTAPPPPPQIMATFAVPQPPPPTLPMFDASRPPPPIPSHVQTINNSQKKPCPNESNAQPRKIRKTEDDVAGEYCDECMQRVIRLETYREEISTLHREEECTSLAYKQKVAEFQNRKDVLRLLVSSDLYNIIEKYIENYSHSQALSSGLGRVSQSPTNASGRPLLSRQVLVELVDYLLEGTRNNIAGAIPTSSLRLEDTISQKLSAILGPNMLQTPTAPRRSNSSRNSDLLHTFVDILNQSNTSEQILPNEYGVESTQNANNSNNFNSYRFGNGQVGVAARFVQQHQPHQYSGPTASASTVTPAPPIPPAMSARPIPPSTPAPPMPPVAPILNATPTPPAPPSTPIPPFAPSHAANTARLYYPPPYRTSPNGGVGQGPRMPPPPPPSTPAPPAVTAPPSTNQPHYMGRYPPPFYPRYS